MEHYSIPEIHSIYIDEIYSSARNVRINTRDDYYGTYNYEESFFAVEQFIEKHSNSLDSIFDRYCF